MCAYLDELSNKVHKVEYSLTERYILRHVIAMFHLVPVLFRPCRR